MQISPSLAQALTNLNLPPYPTVTGLPQPITARSLASFAGALVWAWLLLVSFTGWGRLTGKLFRGPRLPSSVACSLGIASVVFVGGWLNLAHAIYPVVLFAITGLGLIFYLATHSQRPDEYGWLRFWQTASPGSKILIGIALLMLLLRVAATVRLGMFNNLDDTAAYMVFPHKMLAVHSFAHDPFSDRRVISSLGGAYLLQCFVLAATSLSHVAMADRTLGLIVLAAALFDIGVSFELSPIQIALLEFFAYLTPIEMINLTFITLPVPLLLAMAWLLWKSTAKDWIQRNELAFLAGGVGGAAVAAKSTYLPIVAAFLLIPWWMLGWRRQGKDGARLFLLTAFGALSVLLAWMIAMKLTSGTYLFPILGHGVDYSSYGVVQAKTVFHSYRAFLKIFLQAAALLILAALQMRLEKSDYRIRFSAGILLAAAIAITAFNYKSGGDFIWRYNFPQFFAAIIIFYAVVAGIANPRGGRSTHAQRLFYVGIFSLVAMIFYYDVSGDRPRPLREVAMEWKDYKPSLRASLSGLQLASPTIEAQYRTADSALSNNTTALENTAYPFLFNYARHSILIADWPGAASPGESWPLRGSSSQAREFLVNHAIRYLVYDYRYARWEDTQACQALEAPLRNSEELTVLWRMTVIVHHQFDELHARYLSPYDDGKIVVIDLKKARPNPPVSMPDWTLDTSKEQMCSAVLARYLANPLSQTSE
ncbi:MAG: hypothetical protein V4587_04325 [Acidobacteriota bacterium]